MEKLKYSYFQILFFTFLILFAGCFLALYYGTVSSLSLDWKIQLRLPRIILGISVGGSLALSGGILQVLFRNPICEPYTLGIASGAALGAVFSSFFQIYFFGFSLPLFSFIGATLFAFPLGILNQKFISSHGILIVGVMLGFFGASGVSLGLALSPSGELQQSLYWLLGTLSKVNLNTAMIHLGGSFIFWILVYRKFNSLDAALLGDAGARSLGFDPISERRYWIILTSLLVAWSVSFSGMIGFVGLMVPHLVRLIVGSFHRKTVPLFILWGALSLVFSDLIVRILPVQQELPVGVITALWGVPLFVSFIIKGGMKWNLS